MAPVSGPSSSAAVMGSSHSRSGWAPPMRSATITVCCTISTMKITSATRSMERPVTSEGTHCTTST